MSEQETEEPGEAPDVLVTSDTERTPGEDAEESPYRNLWVPLFVVPAAIVVVIVLVFVFFGAITGDEKTPKDNLELMLTGGANERTQAAFNLVRQAGENWRAMETGGELEWEMGAEFRLELEAAWGASDAGDIEMRYVLASLQAQLGDERGTDRLIGLLGSPPVDEAGELVDPRNMFEKITGSDPVAQVELIQLYALFGVGVLGSGLEGERLDRAAAAVATYTEHEDPALRQASAAALQNLPGGTAREALRGLLGAGALELRGQAAISLSHLGDPVGAEGLLELIDPESYELARRIDPTKWTRGENVTRTRVAAVAALARLDRPEDRGLLEQLAADEPDLQVRGEALRALSTQ